jgi:hypothetical protein
MRLWQRPKLVCVGGHQIVLLHGTRADHIPDAYEDVAAPSTSAMPHRAYAFENSLVME